MAGNGKPTDGLRAELVHELADARSGLSGRMSDVRRELDIPMQVRKSVRKHVGLWLGGALALGMIIAIFPARRKKVFVDKQSGKRMRSVGTAMAVAKLAGTVLKPALLALVAKYAGRIAQFEPDES